MPENHDSDEWRERSARRLKDLREGWTLLTGGDERLLGIVEWARQNRSITVLSFPTELCDKWMELPDTDDFGVQHNRFALHAFLALFLAYQDTRKSSLQITEGVLLQKYLLWLTRLSLRRVSSQLALTIGLKITDLPLFDFDNDDPYFEYLNPSTNSLQRGRIKDVVGLAATTDLSGDASKMMDGVTTPPPRPISRQVRRQQHRKARRANG